MTTVRILADDLTGALDAGAPFAARLGPLPVVWREDAIPPQGGAAIDAATRHAGADLAAGVTARLVKHVAGADIAFKKIDSLMRGHALDELAACIESGLFASVVLAPAYPAQRRVTRLGRQYARDDDGGEWRPVGGDLVEGLRARLGEAWARRVRAVPEGALPAGEGVLVCDADGETRLRALCARAGSLARPTLWAGTAGIAEGFFGPAPAKPVPPAGRVLVFAGSRHPVTRAQIDFLRAGGEAGLIDAAQPPDKAWAREMASRRLTVVSFDPDRGEGDGHAARLGAQIGRSLPHLPRPGLFLATGGDTLLALVRALGATALMLGGEAARGIPLGRVVGGAWDGCAFLSKSGAFGETSALARLLSPAHDGAPP